MSKSDYSVSTVYYSDLDSGQRTTTGRSLKSYQLAVTDFNALWDDDGVLVTESATQQTYRENAIKHLICSLKHYKYNQDSKLLLQKIYNLIENETLSIDSSLICSNTTILLNSSDDYTY